MKKIHCSTQVKRLCKTVVALGAVAMTAVAINGHALALDGDQKSSKVAIEKRVRVQLERDGKDYQKLKELISYG